MTQVKLQNVELWPNCAFKADALKRALNSSVRELMKAPTQNKPAYRWIWLLLAIGVAIFFAVRGLHAHQGADFLASIGFSTLGLFAFKHPVRFRSPFLSQFVPLQPDTGKHEILGVVACILLVAATLWRYAL